MYSNPIVMALSTNLLISVSFELVDVLMNQTIPTQPVIVTVRLMAAKAMQKIFE